MRAGAAAFGWFLLGAVLSPLIGLILVLVLPAINQPPAARKTSAAEPFMPEGVLDGVPYRVLPDGRVEAMLAGGRVLFRTVDQLTAAATGQTVEMTKLIDKNAFPHAHNGYHYRIERDSSVTAVTPQGEEKKFRNWNEFWGHAKGA
ncbi:hypothetical protein GMDG_08730 [Pseudogymnoascus destructans 20631-21]|uniref:Uncharacterized protein n=1 Tax=Pseudogymnoascus destructans (strain ATCC MYA-4855 / 20631-21) TaxID=658429 RepID=L8GBH8_PSED2|nr:hypothetical protein GMDG_08730 [Pseudogymnoascus destructans 20631-21]